MKKDNRSRSRADKAASQKNTTMTYEEYINPVPTPADEKVINFFKKWARAENIRVVNVELTEMPVTVKKGFFGKTQLEKRALLTFESPKDRVYQIQFNGDIRDVAAAIFIWPRDVTKCFYKAVAVE